MQFELKCQNCGEIIICDKTILSFQMECSNCAFPIDPLAYPELTEYKAEQDRHQQTLLDRQQEEAGNKPCCPWCDSENLARSMKISDTGWTLFWYGFACLPVVAELSLLLFDIASAADEYETQCKDCGHKW
jgi:hypothetical protein